MGSISEWVIAVILLDTHAVIWLLIAPEELSKRAREEILRARIAGEKIACSPVSLYEIANAAGRGRLSLNATMKDFIHAVQSKVELIPLTAEIAICAAEIPAHFHGDPCDRIIAGTAIVKNCAVITCDDRIRKSNVCKVLW